MKRTEITFVICDDEEKYRDMNKRAVGMALEDHEASVEPAFMFFENGRDALDWFRTRGNADKIILITDGQMPYMTGPELLSSLHHANPRLLPDYCAVVSKTRSDKMQLTLESGRVGNLGIQITEKDYGYRDFIRFISAALDEMASGRPAMASQETPPAPAPGIPV